MPTPKRVGCIKTHECYCKGYGLVPDLIDFLVECPGLTEAEYGHIKKRAKRVAVAQQTRKQEESERVKAHLDHYRDDPDRIYVAWASSTYAGTLICALTKHILWLERQLDTVHDNR